MLPWMAMPPGNFKTRWELLPPGFLFGSSCPTHSLPVGHLGTHASHRQWTTQIYLCPEELELCHPTSSSSAPNHLQNKPERLQQQGTAWVQQIQRKKHLQLTCSALGFILASTAFLTVPAGEMVSTHQNSPLWSNRTKDTEFGSVHGRAVLAQTHSVRRRRQETG